MIVQNSIKTTTASSASSRKRRRSEGIVTQHVFLLPRGELTPQPSVHTPQKSLIANPLAHPLVQETDAALTLNVKAKATTALAPTNHLGMKHHLMHSTDSTQRPNSHFPHIQPHFSCIPLIQQNILLSPMEASSKKRSPFWQAFHQFNTKHPQNINGGNERQHHAACNLCGKTVNMGRDNSTTTLSQHLRKCNRALWTTLKDTVVVIPKKEEPSRPIAPTANALQHYIEVAFLVRFKDPPLDEWAGYIMILHKELNRKLSKETIRGIFQRLSSRKQPQPQQQQSVVVTPRSILPIVQVVNNIHNNASDSGSLSSQGCVSPVAKGS